jgi:hypothetical protein
MSLSQSKCSYSNNCLQFLKCAVPIYFTVVLTFLNHSEMHFCSFQNDLLLLTDFGGILNCDTFSMVPSGIIKNLLNVLFH